MSGQEETSNPNAARSEQDTILQSGEIPTSPELDSATLDSATTEDDDRESHITAADSLAEAFAELSPDTDSAEELSGPSATNAADALRMSNAPEAPAESRASQAPPPPPSLRSAPPPRRHRMDSIAEGSDRLSVPPSRARSSALPPPMSLPSSGIAAARPSGPPPPPRPSHPSVTTNSELPQLDPLLFNEPLGNSLQPFLNEPMPPARAPRKVWTTRVLIAAAVLGSGVAGFVLNRPSDTDEPAAALPAPEQTTASQEAFPAADQAMAAAETAGLEATAAPAEQAAPEDTRVVVDPDDLPLIPKETPTRRAPQRSNETAVQPPSNADAPKTKAASDAPDAPSSQDTTGDTNGTANATLGINSIPASKVSVDGKPQGHTPRIGLSVKPGKHVIVFEHPEHGTRTVTVDVKPGQRRPVSVRF